MVLTPRSIPYFLDYKGEYGDIWDSILIPRLRIIKSGLRVSISEVNFLNDPRMKAVEMGNPSIILKRIEQLNNVVPSLLKEWRKLSQRDD